MPDPVSIFEVLNYASFPLLIERASERVPQRGVAFCARALPTLRALASNDEGRCSGRQRATFGSGKG